MDFNKMLEFVNNLSNEELQKFINIIAGRLTVYVGTDVNNVMQTSDVDNATLNGPSIQLNLTNPFALGTSTERVTK